LPGRIPLAVALELGLTGEPITADRAYELGLVNQVVSRERVLATALALAQQISRNGPLAVAVTKKLMRVAHDEGVAATRQMQKTEVERIFSSDDAQEGARAFAEKREPRWTGR
jgi:enoyl-CoA hydratase